MTRYRSYGSSDDMWSIAAFAFAVILVVAALGGWVANLVKFFGNLNDPLTAMEIARGFGIFMPPIGIVLGFC